MSTDDAESTVTDRLGEGPQLKLSRLRDCTARELVVRFGAGALTSVVAGVVTLLAGPHVGGVMLAFPAILAASLTLIEDEDDSVEAREDARGAIAGAIALALFAVSVALLITHVGAAAILVAGLVWLTLAVGFYYTLWR